MPSPPGSDAAALGRAWRSRPFLLFALLVVALAAALWSWVSARGVGASEDPGRVLVVVEEDEGPLAEALARAGFDARFTDRAGLAALSEEAGLAASGFEAGDDAAALRLTLKIADQLGHGFVAWSGPTADALAPLELDVTPPADPGRWVVLSVGDLAFPHAATFAPAPSEVVRMPGLGLLQALYRQPRLDPARESLTHRPSVEELHLQRRLDPGLNLVRRVGRLEESAADIEGDLAQVIAERGPARPLGDPMVGGVALPLADGHVLALQRRVAVESSDAATLGYRPDAMVELVHLELDGEGRIRRRRPCSALPGVDPQGRVAAERFPEIVVSDHGSTLLWRTRDGGARVYGTTADETERCPLRELASIPSPSEDGPLGLGLPGEAGDVLRVRVVEVEGVEGFSPVLLTPRSEGDARERSLGWIAGRPSAMPRWLGAEVIGVPTQDAIFIFSGAYPGVALQLRLDALPAIEGVPNEAGIADFAALGADGRGILLVLSDGPQTLVRLDWVRPPAPRLAELFEEVQGARDLPERGPADGAASMATPQGMETLRALVDADDLELAAIGREARIEALAVSADGARAAYLRPRGDPAASTREVAVLELGEIGAVARVVSGGPLDERSPRWTSDGRLLLVSSLARVSVRGHQLALPRVIKVEPPSPR